MGLISEIEVIIKDHMDIQPYGCKCSECGSELEIVEKLVDNDYDMRLEIYPCEKCMEKAKVEGE